MKRKKTIGLVVILMVLASLSIGIAAEAALIQNEYNKNSQPQLFDAEITFYVMTGEGCACTPIEGALVAAYGGEGNDSGVTDDDGMCVLTLVILGEYEVYIEAEEYGTVYFEFNVLDDQTFTFHLFENPESSSQTVSLPQRGIGKMSYNGPPTTPEIDGPKIGVPGIEYEYTVVSTDPDGDDVIYCFNWDDDTGELCIGPFPSGEEATLSHIWTEKGTYTINVYASDIHGHKSENATFKVTISRSRVTNTFILQLLEQFPNAFPLLRQLIGLL